MNDFLSNYPDLMQTRHICELFGLSADTVTQKARNGEIPARKIGKKYVFAKPLIAKMLLTADTEEDDPVSDIDAARVSRLR